MAVYLVLSLSSLTGLPGFIRTNYSPLDVVDPVYEQYSRRLYMTYNGLDFIFRPTLCDHEVTAEVFNAAPCSLYRVQGHIPFICYVKSHLAS